MSINLHATSCHKDVGKPPKIWWSNTIFFLSVHIAAAIAVYYFPPWNTQPANLWLWFLTWQLADFGITIGYHRLYSHKAFRASFGVRVVLAVLGSCAFQGSIKSARCLRHRLHHRFTDDPEHDPYAATRGLFYSHMGWIFYKPNYDRLGLVEKDDLEIDPVVRLQHKYYVPLALLSGFVLPTLCGIIWGDPIGSFIYGGLLARLFIWHCTFMVNSLAHWDGLQPYSDDDTSRGNLILALLTGGEGNHNFHHAFPHDFRSGPSRVDWDPSKWIILVLHRLGLVHSLQKARHRDMEEARHYMQRKASFGSSDEEEEHWTGTIWNLAQLKSITLEDKSRCLMALNGFVVDATDYLKEHPGGATLLRKYSVRIDADEDIWARASWAFSGGLNNHSSAARRRMKELRVAKINN
ncbi:fatty acid desaturase-domain-containing protein [Crepidotus variabilis]|uniref:Acyl-CoA desaturase n=1 Tax=Crepidotus variabilis TaxID=179855 RepID=A0A9P6JTH1_9AGAR|nr:fatty acid desaturase-domain-containing protein [Crepidotus variabilis]